MTTRKRSVFDVSRDQRIADETPQGPVREISSLCTEPGCQSLWSVTNDRGKRRCRAHAWPDPDPPTVLTSTLVAQVREQTARLKAQQSSDPQRWVQGLAQRENLTGAQRAMLQAVAARAARGEGEES